MADNAKICDRCNELYRVDLYDEPKYLLSSRVEGLNDRHRYELMDLCPECTALLQDWVEA